MLPTESVSKFHREIPLREVEPDQSFYSLVFDLNADNMERNYSSFFGKKSTFADLQHDTDLLAAALVNAGVKSGDVVGACFLTMPETAPILLAINKIGAASFWLDARAKREDMAHLISSTGIRLLLTIEPLLPVFSGIKGLRKIVVNPMNAHGVQPDPASLSEADTMSYRDFLNSGLDTPIPPIDYKSDRPALIVQSSGSTGKPKSIIHTSKSINTLMVRMAYTDLPFYVGNKSLVLLPPWIIYGLVNSMYTGLVFGMETIFPLEYTDETVYNYLGELNLSFGVPANYRFIYNKICDLKKENTPESLAELSALEEKIRKADLFISGGDALPESDHIKWQIALKSTIVNGYGSNEIVACAVVSPMYANRPGSIGIPTHGMFFKTADPETGELLPDGELGEVVLSSEGMFTEYLNNPEETNRIKRFHEGRWWVHTGDLGRINEDGFVTLAGRCKRVIIDKLGYKISPEKSESYIMKLPHVKECVVVGVEIEPNNRVPMAFIALDCPDKGGSVLSEIIRSCDGLKDYERPKFFKTVSAIPYIENGGKRNFLKMEKMAADYVAKRKKEAGLLNRDDPEK